jgi:uncharacterized membrane protein
MCCYFRAVDRVVLALIIYQAFIYQEVYYVAWKATLSKYSILYSNWNGAIVLALIVLCTKLQYTGCIKKNWTDLKLLSFSQNSY